MGRRQKSAEQKHATGNPGNRPIDDAPELPEVERPTNAPWFLTDGFALKIWAEVAENTKGMNFIHTSDAFALARYCMNMAMWIRETVMLQKEGSIGLKKNRHDTLQKINPRTHILKDLELRLYRLETQLGLTPASRQKLLASIIGLGAGGGLNDLFGADPADPGHEREAAKATLDDPFAHLGHGMAN